MIHFGESKAWTGFDLGVTEEEYSQFNELILKQKHYNGWFTEDMVRKSLLNLGALLDAEKLSPNGRKSMIMLKNQKPLQ